MELQVIDLMSCRMRTEIRKLSQHYKKYCLVDDHSVDCNQYSIHLTSTFQKNTTRSQGGKKCWENTKEAFLRNGSNNCCESNVYTCTYYCSFQTTAVLNIIPEEMVIDIKFQVILEDAQSVLKSGVQQRVPSFHFLFPVLFHWLVSAQSLKMLESSRELSGHGHQTSGICRHVEDPRLLPQLGLHDEGA